mmetsp:Transcript_47960/g.127028  ORF Transcript_47960/g.127028 Transcript_47960/m.127028 type:complete len:245 (+) Transcript_47960:131-865(+)
MVCAFCSQRGAEPMVPSKCVDMHFSIFLRSVCTAVVSSLFVYHTSNLMTFAARGPESLSTRRTPVIMPTGSIVAPIMPRTKLFQYSSTWPPPILGFNWNWKWPPVAFILSSHSGRMFSRKIMTASITCKPSGCSRTIRFCSSNSLGCGMWFHNFQNSCTVDNEATLCVASEYAAPFSLACMICSQMDQVYLKGKSFFSISSFSDVSVVNFKLAFKFSLKLRYVEVIASTRGWRRETTIDSQQCA